MAEGITDLARGVKDLTGSGYTLPLLQQVPQRLRLDCEHQQADTGEDCVGDPEPEVVDQGTWAGVRPKTMCKTSLKSLQQGHRDECQKKEVVHCEKLDSHKLQRAETRNENPATQIPDFEFTILERNLFAEDVNRTRNMAMVKHCRAIFTRQDVGLSHLVEGYLYDEEGNEILQMVSDLQDKATGDTVLNDTDKDLEEARQTCRDFENLNLQKY